MTDGVGEAVAELVAVGDGLGAVGVGVTTGVGVGVVVGPDVRVRVAVAEGDGGVEVGDGAIVAVLEEVGEGEGGTVCVRVEVNVGVGDVGVAVQGMSAAGSVEHGTAVTTGTAFAAGNTPRHKSAAANASGTIRRNAARFSIDSTDFLPGSCVRATPMSRPERRDRAPYFRWVAARQSRDELLLLKKAHSPSRETFGALAGCRGGTLT